MSINRKYILAVMDTFTEFCDILYRAWDCRAMFNVDQGYTAGVDDPALSSNHWLGILDGPYYVYWWPGALVLLNCGHVRSTPRCYSRRIFSSEIRRLNWVSQDSTTGPYRSDFSSLTEIYGFFSTSARSMLVSYSLPMCYCYDVSVPDRSKLFPNRKPVGSLSDKQHRLFSQPFPKIY